jgi:hypothetical protein
MMLHQALILSRKAHHGLNGPGLSTLVLKDQETVNESKKVHYQVQVSELLLLQVERDDVS